MPLELTHNELGVLLEELKRRNALPDIPLSINPFNGTWESLEFINTPKPHIDYVQTVWDEIKGITQTELALKENASQARKALQDGAQSSVLALAMVNDFDNAWQALRLANNFNFEDYYQAWRNEYDNRADWEKNLIRALAVGLMLPTESVDVHVEDDGYKQRFNVTLTIFNLYVGLRNAI